MYLYIYLCVELVYILYTFVYAVLVYEIKNAVFTSFLAGLHAWWINAWKFFRKNIHMVPAFWKLNWMLYTSILGRKANTDAIWCYENAKTRDKYYQFESQTSRPFFDVPLDQKFTLIHRSGWRCHWDSPGLKNSMKESIHHAKKDG